MARLRPSLYLVLAVLMTATSGCGGCNKSSSSRSGAVAPVDEPTPEETPEPVVEPNPAVGEETPPITNDNPAVIDTDTAPSLRHLIFETSDALEAGRYLSEYLIIVRANEDSCVRIKVRPTDGVTDEVDTGAFEGGIEGAAACAGEGWTAPPADPADEEEEEEEAGGASLRGARPFEPELVWATEAERQRRGFALAGQTQSVCAPRLFRMESTSYDGTPGLSPVISKTGLLRVVGTKVRVWVDEEFYPGCDANAAAGTLASPSIFFGPLIQNHGLNATWRDALYMDHLQNLASEMDKIVTTMQADFGPMSDIDDSGFVDIFITPDVNRRYFDHVEASRIDSFTSDLVYRPEDLAYYDAEANPTSNEGEILYLWAPDPAGIYNRLQYPSANSISSNYAKGYLAAQAMTLIMANQRLLVQEQKSIQDRWILEGMSMLASSYYAGNDYSWRAIAQYMTSRPQYVSLSQPADVKLVGEKYLGMAHHEALGLRTLFAWYAHSRLCGATTVAPCKALKSLVTTDKIGEAAMEELLSLSFKELTANFGLSLGISLIEHPATALAFWDKSPLPSGYPAKPTLLPELQEVRPSDPPTTFEATNTGGVYTPPAPPGDKDRTVAGPFPSKDMLIFQPLASDNDFEAKIAKHSVTYILVTGLIDAHTDMTAYFGKGLNVVFVPIGERDGALRRMHIEKLSETAHGDLRPDNLTSRSADAATTYAFDPVYPSLDFNVTTEREVWVLGSIDNYKVNVLGAATTIGDSDAYNLDIQPCDGLTGQDLFDCQAENHTVWVQVVIRDAEKELQPMLVVTASDRGIFRGHSVYDRMISKVEGWTEDGANRIYDVTCQAAAAWPTLEVAVTLPSIFDAAPGAAPVVGTKLFVGTDGSMPDGIVTNQTYTVASVVGTTFTLEDASGDTVVMSGTLDGPYWISTGARNSCANGGYAGKTVFDHSLTALDPGLYAHNYENFLHLGNYGYPFTTRRTESFADMKDCEGHNCYQPVESSRQHLVFAFNEDTKVRHFNYWGTQRFTSTFAGLTQLDGEATAKVASVKAKIDACPGTTPGDDPLPDSAFVEECTEVPGLSAELCEVVCSNSLAVENEAINALTAYALTCISTTCTAQERLTRPGPRTSAWMPPDRLFWAAQTGASRSTYYVPNQPSSTDSYCGGDAVAGVPYGFCGVKSDSLYVAKDLREQLNVDAADFGVGCANDVLGTDFKVCADYLSWHRELRPDDAYAYMPIERILSSDRNYVLNPGNHGDRRYSAIHSRAGEIAAKPERLHVVTFDVPGTGAVANVIVGGRKQSQGKYLLRARLMPDF